MKHPRNEGNLDSSESKYMDVNKVVNELVKFIKHKDTDGLAHYLSDMFELSEDACKLQKEGHKSKSRLTIQRVKEKVMDSLDIAYEIVFTVPDACQKQMNNLKASNLGCSLFKKNQLLDQEEGYCLFLGVNRYDIVHFYGTSSVYYEIITKDIIKMLETWNRRYGIRINGCGKDWLAVDLLNLYYPIENLLYQIAELCPQHVLKKDRLFALNTIGVQDFSTIHIQWK